MTNDLVKQLRKYRIGCGIHCSDYNSNEPLDECIEAADRIEQLEGALSEAIEDIEHWGGYAGEYFQDKWDLKGSIAKARAALAGEKKDD
jgi:hypothetical protein